MHILNPKSITMGQLYGEFDQETHEWSDGILSCLMREGVEDTTPDKKWYVFDGPVDAVWVESMNTLLDDNKKLCLSSGEIIKMTHCQTMMFEVGDLAFASPATVSRCGMIYMEPGALGLKPLIKSNIQKQMAVLIPAYSEIFNIDISILSDQLIEPSMEFLRKNIKEAVVTTNGNLVCSLFKILSCLFSKYETPTDGMTAAAIDMPSFEACLKPFFLFSLIWSVGATSDNDGRVKFSSWLRSQMLQLKIEGMPDDGLVHDYKYIPENNSWVNWTQQLEEFVISPRAIPSEVIVPTIDTIRNSYLIDVLLRKGHHVLCTGPTGVGKSITVQEKLIRGMDAVFTPMTLNFSARTSANLTQDVIDSKLEKRRKGVFGPPVGKKFIIFVDDLNMPQLDICNAQPPVELLRQWMDCNGWYDRKSVGKFMEIVDIIFIAAMGPPGNNFY